MEAEIRIRIMPSEYLTNRQIVTLVKRAAEVGKTPEQLITEAVHKVIAGLGAEPRSRKPRRPAA